MNTGQTMLTIMALAMLSVITMTYYASVGQSGRTLAASNAGLTATTIATSFIERAQNTAFDEASDTTAADMIIANPGLLTDPGALGLESDEDTLTVESFDDFDDFNNCSEDYHPGWMNETYRVQFKVFYVDPNNVNTISNIRTFVKRMDLTVWRVDANLPATDTVKMSTVYGYFKYN